MPAAPEYFLRRGFLVEFFAHVRQGVADLPEQVVRALSRQFDAQDLFDGFDAFVGLRCPCHPLLCLGDGLRVRLQDVRHLVDLLQRDHIHVRLCGQRDQVVRPSGGSFYAAHDPLSKADGRAARALQFVRDLAEPFRHVVPGDVFPDALQGGVCGARAGFYVLQLGPHVGQLCGRRVYFCLHGLERRARLVHAVVLHGLQRFVCLPDRFGLFVDLFLQELDLVLHVELLVSVQLQLCFVQFQLLVKGFYGALRVLHSALEFGDPRDPHLDVYAGCHSLTPLRFRAVHRRTSACIKKDPAPPPGASGGSHPSAARRSAPS